MNPYDTIIGFDGSRRPGPTAFGITWDEAVEFSRANSAPRPVPRVQAIESRLRELEAELADIKRFGDDDYEDGDVLTFKGDFNGPKTYAWAAIKASGKWHLTGGKSIQHASWDALVEFMRGANVRKVRKVTDTERVV